MTYSRYAHSMRFWALLILAGTPTPAFAHGQTPPVPRVTSDVIVTATAAPAPAASVGRTVTVIARAELEQLGIASIIEALRLVAGVDPRARGGTDVQTDFRLRGATFGQSLVLLDGARLNDSQSGHHNGEIPAPLMGIDRIEVVFGPASAVHGADALGGTIHVITRTDSHATALATLGEHRTLTGQGSASGGWRLWTGPSPDGVRAATVSCSIGTLPRAAGRCGALSERV